MSTLRKIFSDVFEELHREDRSLIELGGSERSIVARFAIYLNDLKLELHDSLLEVIEDGLEEEVITNVRQAQPQYYVDVEYNRMTSIDWVSGDRDDDPKKLELNKDLELEFASIDRFQELDNLQINSDVIERSKDRFQRIKDVWDGLDEVSLKKKLRPSFQPDLIYHHRGRPSNNHPNLLGVEFKKCSNINRFRTSTVHFLTVFKDILKVWRLKHQYDYVKCYFMVFCGESNTIDDLIFEIPFLYHQTAQSAARIISEIVNRVGESHQGHN